MKLRALGLSAIAFLLVAADTPEPAEPAQPVVDDDLSWLPTLEAPEAPPLPPVEPLTLAGYREGAFKALQWAYRSSAASALEQNAARAISGNEEIVSTEQRMLDIRDEIERINIQLDNFSKAIPVNDEQREAFRQREVELRARRTVLNDELNALLARLNERFPAYSEYVRPQAAGFLQTQRVLKPDEAMLMIAPTKQAVFLFAMTDTKVEWYRVTEQNRDTLREAVARLREGLDLSTRTASDDAERGAIPTRQQEAAQQEARTPTYDRQLAYTLYQQLIAPAEALFEGKRVLMTVTSDALAALPLAALVTAPPPGDDASKDAMRATSWLADRYLLVSIPAMSSLESLRCRLTLPQDRKDGCPGYEKAVEDRSFLLRDRSLDLFGAGAPTLAGAPDAALPEIEEEPEPEPEDRLRSGLMGLDRPVRARPAPSDTPPVADADYLRQLPRLPGSERELRGLRDSFGPSAVVRIGRDATEQDVRSDAAIGTSRFIVFSTHGLLAGQAGVANEPGLVMTPPTGAASDPAEDGLLTATEIAQLRMNADFVVLSACNTAAGGGNRVGEGLSGLARAFFFAGARAVLVSHWEVSDRATQQLILTTFQSLGQPGIRGRAEALQAGMARLRENPDWVEPRFWAAFTLVGEPG